MARTRVITRTVVGTKYTCMTVDTTAATVGTKELTITGTVLEDEKALKRLQKLYDTDTLKVVSITAKESVDQIYGMLESDFIKLAKPMDAERHFIGEDTGEVDELEIEEVDD